MWATSGISRSAFDDHNNPKHVTTLQPWLFLTKPPPQHLPPSEIIEFWNLTLNMTPTTFSTVFSLSLHSIKSSWLIRVQIIWKSCRLNHAHALVRQNWVQVNSIKLQIRRNRSYCINFICCICGFFYIFRRRYNPNLWFCAYVCVYVCVLIKCFIF